MPFSLLTESVGAKSVLVVARPVPVVVPEAGKGLARHRRGLRRQGRSLVSVPVPVVVAGAGAGLLACHRRCCWRRQGVAEPGEGLARHRRHGQGSLVVEPGPVLACQGDHLPFVHEAAGESQVASEDVDAAVVVREEGQLPGGVDPETEAALDLVLETENQSTRMIIA